jgi:molybdopterin-binding protein
LCIVVRAGVTYSSGSLSETTLTPQPAMITSMITKEAAEDLKLKVGDEVEAVIKASEVMVLKE